MMSMFDSTLQGTELLLFIISNLSQLNTQKICHKNTKSALDRNCNSRFPPLFSVQIPNIMTKKSQILHPAKLIGDPQIRQRRKDWWSRFLFSLKLIISESTYYYSGLCVQKKACSHVFHEDLTKQQDSWTKIPNWDCRNLMSQTFSTVVVTC